MDTGMAGKVMEAEMGKGTATTGTAMAAMKNRHIKITAMEMKKGTAATATATGMAMEKETDTAMVTVIKPLAPLGATGSGTTTGQSSYSSDRSRFASSREGVRDGSTPFNMAR